MRGLRSSLYAAARLLGTIIAVVSGPSRIAARIINLAIGRSAGRVLGRLYR